MTTFRELTRILNYNSVLPDMALSIAIFADTKPQDINVLIEDNTAYITEKRA